MSSLSANHFRQLEMQSKESINFKKLYVDICDDLVSGILLSQIFYWFCEGKDGTQRAKFKYQDRTCIIKRRSDWWKECRISEKQYDRSMKILKDKGFVTVEIHRCPMFHGETACYIFLDENQLIKCINNYLNSGQYGNPELTDGEFQNLPMGNSRIDQTVIPSYSIQRLHTKTTERESAAEAGAHTSSFSLNSSFHQEEEKDQKDPEENGDAHKRPITQAKNTQNPTQDRASSTFRSDNVYYVNSTNRPQEQLEGTFEKLISCKKNNKNPSQDPNKISRHPNVHTTQEEHENLVESFGNELVQAGYNDLSEWKYSKTEKENNKATDYGRLKKWVIPSIQERNIKSQELKLREERLKKGNTQNGYSNTREDIRKRQNDEWVKHNGSPNDSANIIRFSNDENK